MRDKSCYLLVVQMLVGRGGANLVSWDWALKLHLDESFTAQVRWCVMGCFSQANLDILISHGKQVTQDLKKIRKNIQICVVAELMKRHISLIQYQHQQRKLTHVC